MSIISIPCVPICSGGWWQGEREVLMAAVDAFDVPHRLCTLFTVNINQLLVTPNVFNFVDNKVSMVAKATAKQQQLQRNISRHYVPRIDIYLYCIVVGCYIFVQHLFVCFFFFIWNVKNFSCCCCCCWKCNEFVTLLSILNSKLCICKMWTKCFQLTLTPRDNRFSIFTLLHCVPLRNGTSDSHLCLQKFFIM